ncbi:hypothetical protein [Diaphorobacter aerolatus]|uniref:DUF4124 domain-containing protein n=1 Tax=Diaphorobacter aerolatus TaxID=1288495 RepID=A0A7H0GLC8_9BURK|nr:hypothetical protein [Diaphorobacter aerolatus]QNP49094.1 hypothetical protein H9K75_02790 [Diaphorobacter aerolatus]
MATLYKYQNASGGLVYSDRPPDPHAGERYAPQGETDNRCYARMFCGEKPRDKSDYQKAKEYTAAAQKHIPKLKEYVEMLDYLRSHDEAGFRAAMKELQQKNPRAWMELQKSPLFRNPKEISQFENSVKAGAKILTKPGDAQSYMDGWYERVKTNAQARGYVESKPELVPLAKSNASVRTAAGSAVSRVGGTILQFEMAALDPDTGRSVGVIALRFRLDTLAGFHPGWTGTPMDIAGDEYQEISGYLSSGDYSSAKAAMDSWVAKHR